MNAAQWCNQHFKDAWRCISARISQEEQKTKSKHFWEALKLWPQKWALLITRLLVPSGQEGAFSSNALSLISIQQTHRDGKKQRHLSSLTACNSSRLPPKASLGYILKARPGSLRWLTEIGQKYLLSAHVYGPWETSWDCGCPHTL